MKRFMTTTAIALLIGTSAMADGHTAMFSDTPFDAEVNLTGSDLIGARVYATENDVSAMNSATTDESTEWDHIGDINELILTRDGSVQSVIVGVGGFLGIGERDVAINMEDLRFISDGEEADEYFVVINASVQGITDAPAYETPSYAGQASMAETRMPETEGTMEDTDAELADVVDDNRGPGVLTPPMIERDGYMAAMPEDLTADDLTGARVYGPGDEDVGEVGELLLGDEGQIERAVIDVGGFLGMGEHHVAVSLDELTIIRSDDGDDLRVYIDSTQEVLENMPEYEG